jgi:hypothetical protein
MSCAFATGSIGHSANSRQSRPGARKLGTDMQSSPNELSGAMLIDFLTPDVDWK